MVTGFSGRCLIIPSGSVRSLRLITSQTLSAVCLFVFFFGASSDESISPLAQYAIPVALLVVTGFFAGGEHRILQEHGSP